MTDNFQVKIKEEITQLTVYLPIYNF